MGIIKYKDIAYGIGGGGGSQAYGGVESPSIGLGNSGDYYYQYDQTTGDVQIVYVKLNDIWHKIIGGNIGEPYYTINGHDILMAIGSDEDAMAHEGVKEEEQ